MPIFVLFFCMLCAMNTGFVFISWTILNPRKRKKGWKPFCMCRDEWLELERQEERSFSPSLKSCRATSCPWKDPVTLCSVMLRAVLGNMLRNPILRRKCSNSCPILISGGVWIFFMAGVQELADGEEQVAAVHPSGIPLFSEWERAFRAWAARQAIGRVTTITPYADKPKEERQA